MNLGKPIPNWRASGNVVVSKLHEKTFTSQFEFHWVFPFIRPCTISNKRKAL